MTKLSIVGKFVLATAEFLKIRIGVATGALLPSFAFRRGVFYHMPKIGSEICEKTHRARAKKACANRFRGWCARWAAVQVVINALLNKAAFQIRPFGTNFTG
jgi:hypothetical protein